MLRLLKIWAVPIFLYLTVGSGIALALVRVA